MTVTLTREQLTLVLEAVTFAEEQNEWHEKLAQAYHATLTALQAQQEQSQ